MKSLNFFPLLILFSGCLCCGIGSQNDPIPLNVTVNVTSTTTTTLDLYAEVIKAAEKDCPVCKPCPEKVTMIETRYINVTLNLSDSQLHEIKNLKPEFCATASCNAGFFEAKYKVFDELGISRPKFSERESPGFIPFAEETQCVPVYNDGFSDYFELPNDLWYWVTNDTNGKIKFRKER